MAKTLFSLLDTEDGTVEAGIMSDAASNREPEDWEPSEKLQNEFFRIYMKTEAEKNQTGRQNRAYITLEDDEGKIFVRLISLRETPQEPRTPTETLLYKIVSFLELPENIVAYPDLIKVEVPLKEYEHKGKECEEVGNVPEQ